MYCVFYSDLFTIIFDLLLSLDTLNMIHALYSQLKYKDIKDVIENIFKNSISDSNIFNSCLLNGKNERSISKCIENNSVGPLGNFLGTACVTAAILVFVQLQ